MTPIIELRQYTLHSGQRDVLIELFEREFIAPQEALGMRILGTFRDLDRPDRFVWIRGFPDMASRAEALQAFYSGPVWQAHRDAANATMIDSDNVLLLREARPGSGLTAGLAGRVIASICSFDAPVAAEFLDWFDRAVRPDATVLGTYVTEESPNNFPRLPVRENEHVFVSFTAEPLKIPAEELLRLQSTRNEIR